MSSRQINSIITSLPTAFNELGELQRQDVTLQSIMDRLETGAQVPSIPFLKEFFIVQDVPVVIRLY